jgi:predicted transcriptional regulator
MEDQMRNQQFNTAVINRLITAQGTTRYRLAKKMDITPSLLYYYLSSEATIYKAKRIAAALSTEKKAVKWKDLII